MNAKTELGDDLEVTVGNSEIDIERYGESVRLTLDELKQVVRFVELFKEYTK